ncbi:MAG: ATP-dependent RNA helicase DbpA [Gammaproteobacteria bacterium]|nr:ATP-dependent RNA helicase DbpA [Gammaproteobacteria bacterium]
MTHFNRLPLDPAILTNLDALGYTQMTPIQSQCLPQIMQGHDIIAQAKTGSGKTAAFGLGLLHRLIPRQFAVQALVVCPTRELADQVGKEIRSLARNIPNIKLVTLCGGTPIKPQYESLQHGSHIVVGTPGRLQKHLQEGTLKLDKLQVLVLDEADRMLDMGFYDDMVAILQHTPLKRQTLLFSATYPDTIRQLSAAFQHEPVEVRIESEHEISHIKQLFFEFQKGARTKTLLALLAEYRPETTLIFCNTRQQCQELVEDLKDKGLPAQTIHGDMEQKERDQVLIQFANRSCPILVATDVAARGLDIKDLDAVINFELTRDPEVHIHRIGRTGRAGKTGLALSLFMPSEANRVNMIETYQNSPVQYGRVKLLAEDETIKLKPTMVTLRIQGGRKDKLRPGDILGALTKETGIPAKQIGKIDVLNTVSFVAVERPVAKQSLKQLTEGKIKGRKFRIKRL